MNRNAIARPLNALMIIVLMSIIVTAFFQQYFRQESPCPLCILQRLAMIGIGTGLFFNLRYGIRPFYYGLALLFAIVGRIVSLRQIALHVCPGSAPPFGYPVFGLELYTWAFLAFLCSSFAIVIFLFLSPNREMPPAKMTWFEKFSAALLFFVALANFITTFMQCGFGLCNDVPWPPP